VGNGKIVGLICLGVGLLVELLAVAWLFSQIAGGNLQAGGFILGLMLFQVIAIPFFGVGGYLFIQGRQETAEFAEMDKERAILNMVQTQGKVKISDIALERKLTRDQVKNYVYDLVGKGLFTGYVNWADGVLVSKTASEMKTTKCPNCGGEREVVGQGVVKCPYCGSELFVS
jgi:DNA-directed RNA polymerase subunit RPC12/RpoP